MRRYCLSVVLFLGPLAPSFNLSTAADLPPQDPSDVPLARRRCGRRCKIAISLLPARRPTRPPRLRIPPPITLPTCKPGR